VKGGSRWAHSHVFFDPFALAVCKRRHVNISGSFGREWCRDLHVLFTWLGSGCVRLQGKRPERRCSLIAGWSRDSCIFQDGLDRTHMLPASWYRRLICTAKSSVTRTGGPSCCQRAALVIHLSSRWLSTCLDVFFAHRDRERDRSKAAV
jgi:hypothetical protein